MMSSAATTTGATPPANARLRRLIVAVLTVALTVLSGITVGAQPAHAASQLLVSVVAVDASTRQPITTISATQAPRRIAFQVDFSCLTEVCDDATVAFDPMALDPNYGAYRLLDTQTGFVPPSTGGSISGSAAAGYTVALGDLNPGINGRFVVEYGWPAAAGVAGGGRVNSSTQNFPNGFPITATVRGRAVTAVGETVATSAPVTWAIATPTAPTIAQSFAAPASGFFATDTNITYNLAMATGCGSVDRVCASGYTVTHQLPPGAELVSATGSPTTSGSVATGLVLTWVGPPWAATGPTSQGGWNPAQTLTITFPRANVAPPGQSCGFTTQFSGPTGRVDATYISMPGVPGDVRSATLPAIGPFSLRCADPFPRAEQRGKISTMDGAQRLENNTVSPVVIPTSGTNLKEWQVTVANTANIPGIAVVTDDTLDLQDLPVYQIVAPAGSTIAWTATNGTTTQSGTSTGTADAPAGYRFATSTVTSPVLAAPNQIPEQNFRTDFTVRYRYAVSPDATPGARRTNTASAVMTWPANPEFAAWPLTIPPHTVQLIAPFARSVFFKYADTFLVNPIGSSRIMGQNIDVPVPAAGESDRILRWNAVVANTGSAPAVPTVVDTHLGDNPDMPITQIIAGIRVGNPPPAIASGTLTQNIAFTAEILLDNGTTVNYSGINYTAPAGRRIMEATVTGPRLDGANVFPTTNASRQLEVYFQGLIPTNAARDTYTTNSFEGSLDYGVSGLGIETGDGTSTIHLVGLPPTITASLGAPSIAGGASAATPTTNVTFSVCGTTTNVSSDHVPFTPEYVFMAPAGWNITPGSSSFHVGTVPPGVSFTYRTTVIDGVQRQVAVAAWPGGITFGMNATLPCMSVVARPDPSVAAGTSGLARGFVGNTGDVQPADIFTREFTDTPDIDGNPATMRFSEAAPITPVPVAAVAAMQVVKEICLPDDSQPGGCQWFADPDHAVGVPPDSDSIRYRLTVTNIGNSALQDVVGYDILPYPGDTGTSEATGAVARGSTFQETVESVTAPTNGATATYSADTQPCRDEVDPTVADCVDDWGPTASGAQAIRIEKAGDLLAGQSFSMEYTAAVEGSPSFGAVACNSFAVRAGGLALVSEPAPVCASIEETDLEIVAGTPQVQQGRPGILPWTVTNNGGAQSAIASVAFGDIPAGLTVTSFAPDGWTCTATDADGNPVFGTAIGPATLSCTSDGPLLMGVAVPLNIPVIATTTNALTIPAAISGRMFDPIPGNNTDVMELTATAAAGDIGVTKDDGVTTATPGQLLTYAITVSNPLDFETVADATLTDTLPAGVEFVSASGGGVHSAGTVTWSLPDLPGGADLTRTLTVRVLPTIAAASITNTAEVEAPDPAIADAVLSGRDDDVDTVVTDPGVTLTKTPSQLTFAAVGDTIEYVLVASNSGDVTLTDVTIDDPLDGLTPLVFTWPGAVGVLGPDQSVTAVGTYTITQTDLDVGSVANTATTSGTPPSGAAVADDASALVTSTAAPSISVTKSASPTIVTTAGETIEYTITVVNDGPVTLEDVTVIDLLPGLPALEVTWPGDEGVLSPGDEAVATATYTVTQPDIDAGELVNTASAAGTTPGGIEVTDDDTETVTMPAAPAISVVKDADYAAGTAGRVGETLEYDFTVRNTGNVTLTDVTLVDELEGLSEISFGAWPGAVGVLGPGQIVTATASYVVTQADVDGLLGVTNTATATGTPPTGPAVSDDDTVTIRTPAVTGIQVRKTATLTSQSTVRAGDIVEYAFEVTNVGDLTLRDVELVDALPGLSPLELTWPETEGVLASGQVLTATAVYELTQADIDRGSLENIARATGVGPDEVEATDTDTAVVVLPAEPGLAFRKTAAYAGPAWREGGVVDFAFTLENTGNVTLTGVMITDPMPGLSAIEYSWPGSPGVLAPGETATATATYALTAVDLRRGTVTNTATATTDRGTAVLSTAELTGTPTAPDLPVTGGSLPLWLLIVATGLIAAGASLLRFRHRSATRA